MRRSGYQVVDAIVDRLSELGHDKAFQTAPRDITEALLDGPPPEEGRDLEPLLETVVRDVMPLAARIDHPRFLAFVPASPSWASVLASFLISGYNVFQGTWLASAGPSQIELTVTDWFRDWLGYPKGAGGLFTSGGSAANLLAVVAAREAAGNSRRGVVYVSDQAHGSVGRAARIAGVDPTRIRVLATDGEFRIVPATLLEAVRQDRERGPGTVLPRGECRHDEHRRDRSPRWSWRRSREPKGSGTTSTPRTAASPSSIRQARPRLQGLELADSVTLDPHKWLMQPYETGCLMARDITRLESAFRILPDYMQDTDLGSEQVNFCNRGLQLTRAFRALRVWLSVQRYGLAAHRQAIAAAIGIAARAADRIAGEDELELLAPPSLGVVCFRYRGPGAEPPIPSERLDELNRQIQDRIVQSGFAMIASTRLDDRFSLRFCVLNTRTTEDDVMQVLDRVLEIGRELQADG